MPTLHVLTYVFIVLSIVFQADQLSSKTGDKIEMVFKKFDTNNDGFLSREEFDNMMKDHSDKNQADRIFRSADKAKDGKISLEEFRHFLKLPSNAKK